MNIKKFLIFSISSLFIVVLFTSWQVAAEKPNYYIDISLFSEGYAKFKIDVDNYGNLSDAVIELPTLKCEDNFTSISDFRRKLKVTDIPDIQIYKGVIDLKENCNGVRITRPSGISRNSTISFTYQNFDWKERPENYPFDSYYMPILISFPLNRMEDSVTVSIKILLPPNMVVVKNHSAYSLWSHPANTYTFNDNELTIDKEGNQQIIVFEKNIFLKDNSPPVIYIPLEFEREYSLLQFPFLLISVFLIVSLILLSAMVKKGINDISILTIITLILSSHQLLIKDKPVGATTTLDKLFLFFLGWSFLLFIFHLVNRLGGLRTTISKLWNKSEVKENGEK